MSQVSFRDDDVEEALGNRDVVSGFKYDGRLFDTYEDAHEYWQGRQEIVEVEAFERGNEIDTPVRGSVRERGAFNAWPRGRYQCDGSRFATLEEAETHAASISAPTPPD